MFENIENLKLIFSSYGERKKVNKLNRKSHVLIFRTSGCGMHKFENNTLLSPRGSITFIPAGSSYTFEPLGNEPCFSISVTFMADMRNPKPVVFNNDTSEGIQNIALNIFKNFKLHNPYSMHICLSHLHSVFAYLVNQESLSYPDQRKVQVIKPAVNYINDNLYSPKLKTDNLHCLCGISPTYFRSIFKLNFGMSPQKYIEEKRLEYAFSLIKENTYLISEIAEMSGYSNPLYFGKVFKKKYGISPSYIGKE